MFEKAKKALVSLAFKVLDKHVVDKLITYKPLHDYVEKLLEGLKKVVSAMTDKDPDNEAQLKAIWESEKEGLFDDTLDIAAAIVRDKIKDADTAAMVSQLLLDLKGQELK